MNFPPDQCFVIAEAGVNHNGSLDMAKKLVDAAALAGADAVKFQTFKAEALVTATADRASYQKQNMGGNQTQLEMLKSLELSFDEFRELKKYCDSKQILFLSTPFDEECATFLVRDCDMPLVKVSSGDANNLPFLKFLASLGKPLILSTGMCDLKEVEESVKAIRDISSGLPVALLHCTSNYPCPYEEVNLKAMHTLSRTLNLPVGYSDHTSGIEVSIAAAALGARFIEKHYTLDRNLPGPDHKCSLLPDELKNLITSIRNVETSLGHGRKEPVESELAIRALVRKSLVLKTPVKAGQKLAQEHLQLKRPGTGIPPRDLETVLEKSAKQALEAGHVLRWTDLE